MHNCKLQIENCELRIGAGAALTTLAVVGWLVLALARLRSASLLGALLAAQAGLTAILLILRRSPQCEAPLRWRLLAWASALLPLAMRPALKGALWWSLPPQLIGLLLALWALLSLGDAFGIAPADRGLVVHGPYRWLRHPAYAGALLNVTAFALANASVFNASILLALVASVVGRCLVEERVIDGYGVYAACVRWRLLPGVW